MCLLKYQVCLCRPFDDTHHATSTLQSVSRRQRRAFPMHVLVVPVSIVPPLLLLLLYDSRRRDPPKSQRVGAAGARARAALEAIIMQCHCCCCCCLLAWFGLWRVDLMWT